MARDGFNNDMVINAPLSMPLEAFHLHEWYPMLLFDYDERKIQDGESPITQEDWFVSITAA